MSDFNPGANLLIGEETLFHAYREELLNAPGQEVLQRIRPGAVTLTHVHLHNPGSRGNPGLNVAIYDDPDPATTETIYVPTAETLVTSWVDNAGGAVTAADVDERFNVAEFARNQNAVRKGGALTIILRPTLGIAGARVLRVKVGAVVQVGNNAGNIGPFTVEGVLRFNNVDFPGPRRALARATKGQTTVPLSATLAQPVWYPELATYHFDPSTNLPWTLAGFNTLDDANYGFGLTVRGQLAAGGLAAAGLWMEVLAATENRKGFLHMIGAPFPGWARYALGSTSALNANQWYWLAVSCPYATANDWLRVPILRSVYTPEATAATEAREHRRVSTVKLWTPAGVPPTVNGAAPSPNPNVIDRTGEMMPALLELAGPTINTQSQPYAFLDKLVIDTTTLATAQGQQHTPAAGLAIAGVRLPTIWANPAARPDRPLIVEVQNGVNAITGAGTVVARATISPARTTHEGYITVAFDLLPAATFVTDGNQYHVHVRSAASPARGWRYPRLDSRSDLIQAATAAYATPTTLAQIEGTTQGGQTDSYFVGGVGLDRYDLSGLVLVQAPTAPANLTVTPVAAVTGDVPDVPSGWTGEISPIDAVQPYLRVQWDATALGASFNGYRLWRRPRSLPVREWTLVADYDPLDYPYLTRAVIEAQFLRFNDYEAGASVPDAEGADGWDFAIQVLHLDGRESFIGSSTDVANDLEETCVAWWGCNARPELNCPFSVERSRSSETEQSQVVYEAAGHDYAVTRAIGRVPVRRRQLRWAQHGYLSDWTLRVQEAAALSGEQGVLLSARGDRHYGTLDFPDVERDSDPVTVAKVTLVETARESAPARYNLPEEIVLDGVNQYISVPSHAAINPGAAPFTFFLVGRFPVDALDDVYLSKGDVFTGTVRNVYGFYRSSAGVLAATVAGAAAQVVSSTARPVDGLVHVVAADYNGATLNLYLDGALVDSDAAALGAVTNTDALIVGGDGGDPPDAGNNFAAMTARAFGLFPRALSASEHEQLYRYFAQWFGVRLPVGGLPFYDVADLRCHDGVGTRLQDLGGSQYEATLNNAPAIRGEPWPLVDLDGR